jgi:hypothetical protein
MLRRHAIGCQPLFAAATLFIAAAIVLSWRCHCAAMSFSPALILPLLATLAIDYCQLSGFRYADSFRFHAIIAVPLAPLRHYAASAFALFAAPPFFVERCRHAAIFHFLH